MQNYLIWSLALLLEFEFIETTSHPERDMVQNEFLHFVTFLAYCKHWLKIGLLLLTFRCCVIRVFTVKPGLFCLLSVPEVIDGNTLTATVVDLNAWVEYEFRVLARNSVGVGEPSPASLKTRTEDAGESPTVFIYTQFFIKVI